MKLLRIIRGIAKTAITWSIAWIPLSLAWLGVSLSLSPTFFPPGVIWIFIVQYAVIGAINGAVFGTVVAIAGRQKTFATLSLRWIALCGAVGGAVFPMVIRSLLLTFANVSMPVTAIVATGAASAVLGAICATASLALARRAPELRRPDEPPPAIGVGAA